MNSLLLMGAGLALLAVGTYVVRGEASMEEAFAVAKYYYICGGALLLGGMVVNHWEHTRRGK